MTLEGGTTVLWVESGRWKRTLHCPTQIIPEADSVDIFTLPGAVLPSMLNSVSYTVRARDGGTVEPVTNRQSSISTVTAVTSA